ncbi:polysaccharide deacetylase [Arthrobacter sp. Hiyo8]|nr:polysaccharide deacetylase [Arthrobacter sp. Hiyo8]
MAGDGTISFQVGGVGGVPATAAATIFNLTVANSTSFGFVTAYPSGAALPNASNLNYATGQIVPNSVTIPIGPDGKVNLYNRSGGTAQLIADVSGYFL